MERNGREMITALAAARPDVAITVSKREDPYPGVWDGDGPDPAEEGYICYMHEVRATTIRKGVLLSGSDYLGGSWYAPDDESPCAQEIGGYLPQMIDEAVAELDRVLAEEAGAGAGA